MLKKISLLIVLMSLPLLLLACGGQSAAPEPAAPPAAGDSQQAEVQPVAQVEAPGSIALTGAGATFPFPLYSRWFYEYAFVDPAVRFNYQSIGSGGGIRQITSKTVDFGGSDAILNDENKAAAPGLQQLPIVAGAVVAAYNVNDANGDRIETGLLLTPDIIVDIFLGNITNWNDDRLQELNPDIAFPDQRITVGHRSDGSGTTFLFVSYLSQVSDEWRETVGVGTSVAWPVGLGGRGNEGVAGVITEQPGSIGYIELAYAKQNNIPYAFVQNQEGNFIEPSLESTTAASDASADEMPDDLGHLLTNAPGADSYPIAGYTFILAYEDMDDCVKARKLIEFMRWAMSAEGDQYALELQYAPLGPGAQALVEERLEAMTCEGGQPIFGG